MRRAHWKRPWCWQTEGRRRGTTEDEMVRWHHQFDGHEFEQAPEVGDGQGSLVCCSPWGHEESNMTERLNWTDWLSFFPSWISRIPSGTTFLLPEASPCIYFYIWTIQMVQNSKEDECSMIDVSLPHLCVHRALLERIHNKVRGVACPCGLKHLWW